MEKALYLLAVCHLSMFKNVDIVKGINDHKVVSATIKTAAERTDYYVKYTFISM
jgi:hypothetical protein